MKRNIVISAVGNNGFFRKWTDENDNFDLLLIYYQDDDKTFNELKNDGFNVIKAKGEKWHLVKKFLLQHPTFFELYDNFWFPDDDLIIDSNSINNLFNIHTALKLWLSQPSLVGYISHEINRHDPKYFLRYTNFVEIMCPMMSSETVQKLVYTFDLNESCWGLDYLWPEILGHPKDRIAIIDEIQVVHTRKFGKDHTRFKSKIPPHEQDILIKKMFSLKDTKDRVISVINK